MSDQPAIEIIACECGFRIWDGEVVRARVLRILPDQHFSAKCPRCKRWNRLPVKFSEKKAG